MPDEQVVLNNPNGWVLGKGPRMQELMRQITRVAVTQCSCLVVGETGCGKEIVVDLIHQNGPRKDGPLVPVNCPAVPDSLFEALYFGSNKGSYTGSTRTTSGYVRDAHKGILFLDEVGELNVLLQPKLLRAVELFKVMRLGETVEEKIDLQLIAATNRDLLGEIAAARFREDFYYRLSTLTIEVPPLRDRPEDIPLLMQFYCRRYATKYAMSERVIDADTERNFVGYGWPGNIRQLSHVIEQAYVLDQGLALPKQRPMEKEVLPTLNMAELLQMAIRIAHRRADGSASQAAKLLGITTDKLLRRAPKDVVFRTRTRTRSKPIIPDASPNGQPRDATTPT